MLLPVMAEAACVPHVASIWIARPSTHRLFVCKSTGLAQFTNGLSVFPPLCRTRTQTSLWR